MYALMLFVIVMVTASQRFCSTAMSGGCCAAGGANMKRALDIVLLVLAGLAVWQAMHLAAPFALTSPADTAARAWQMLASATFWPHAAETAEGVSLRCCWRSSAGSPWVSLSASTAPAPKLPSRY